MKDELSRYTFSEMEIRILKELVKGYHSLKRVRKRLSIKPNVLSYHSKKLLSKQIIRFARKEEGLQKYIYFSNSSHASLLRELMMKFSHIPWENVLAYSGIEILFEVMDDSGISYQNFSRVTFWRYSKKFMALGIIKEEESGYIFTSRFSILVRFLEEYQRFIINNLVKSISEKAVTLWRKGLECLIRIPKNDDVPSDGFLKTATSRFPKFGIRLLSDYQIYFYSQKKKKIRLEDVILHTLLIDRDNTRYVTYCLILLKKTWRIIDKEHMLKEAQRLDLIPQIKAMLHFLKTEGERRRLVLPTWNEFTAKAAEYGVRS